MMKTGLHEKISGNDLSEAAVLSPSKIQNAYCQKDEDGWYLTRAQSLAKVILEDSHH